MHLSSFTLDDYEHALRHSLADPPCNLLAEIHSVLIYNLRTVPFERLAGVSSLKALQERNRQAEIEDGKDGVPSIDDLLVVMSTTGNNWERVPLKHSDSRSGWQEALVGCLKDVCSLYEASISIAHFLTNFTVACHHRANSSPS